MDSNKESFAKDKEIAEILEMLSQIKDRDGYQKLMDTVSYVDSLENTLSSMMNQIADMREEIKNVHEQNEYLMSRAERGIKDILVEQIDKIEAKIQEMRNQLSEIKDNIKTFAADTVHRAKMFGNRALLKLADITHVRQALEGIRNKADNMVGRLESLSDMVEDYKTNASREAEQSREPYQEDAYQQSAEPVLAVDEGETYQEGQQSISYEEAMEQFMEKRVFRRHPDSPF